MLLTVAAAVLAAAALTAHSAPAAVRQGTLRRLSHPVIQTWHDEEVDVASAIRPQARTVTYHSSLPVLRLLLPLLAHCVLCLANGAVLAAQGQYPAVGLAAGLLALDVVGIYWAVSGAAEGPLCLLLGALLAWPLGVGFLCAQPAGLYLVISGTLGALLLIRMRQPRWWWAAYELGWLVAVAACDELQPPPMVTEVGLLLNVLLPCCLLVAVTMGADLLSATDAQELHRAWEQERRAMQACIATKTQLLGTLAHEVRTPLNAMLQSVLLLQDSSLTADQRVLAQCIVDCGEQVKANVTSVLEFMRLRHGKVRLNAAAFPIAALCESCLALVRHSAARKGIQLKMDLTACCSGCLVGDAARLRQVLSNLLSNAVKFVKEGHVLLRANMAKGAGGTMHIRFEVSDTGCGIAPADQARLFRPFQQASSATWEQHGGSGLGLCICQELVNLMGGRIGIDPERTKVGVGSCFFVELTLPFVPLANLPPARRASPPMQGLSLSFAHSARSSVYTSGISPSWTFPSLHHSRGPAAWEGITASRSECALRQESALCTPDWLVDPADVSLTTRSGLALATDPLLASLAVHDTLAAAPRPEAGRHPFAQEEVLLADDNALNRMVMGRVLQAMGFAKVHLASDGAEALAMWRGAPDVRFVVLDYRMPHRDGLQVSAEIHREYMATVAPRRPPFCVLLSGEDVDLDEQLADYGIAACLTKPTSRQQLEDVLRSALLV